MLSLPLKWDDTVSKSCWRWERIATSQTEPVTSKPFADHLCNILLSSASVREQVWTEAPNSANSSTTAYPIPRVVGSNKLRVYCANIVFLFLCYFSYTGWGTECDKKNVRRTEAALLERWSAGQGYIRNHLVFSLVSC